MAPPDRVLPRSRRAGTPQVLARGPGGFGPAQSPRRISVLRGQGLERDLKSMAIVVKMLRQGAGRWLRALSGTS